MEELNAQTLAARVARLESTLRRDRTIALAAVAILFATAQSTPTASSPVIVRGETTAELTQSGISIRDASGHQRLFVGLDSKGRPSVDMSDPTGALRQSMFLTSENAPVVRQFDSSGTDRLELYLGTSDQQPNIRLNDNAGKRRLSAFIGTDSGNPEIAVYGTDEKARGYMVAQDAGAYLDVRDNSGTVRAQMGLYPSGQIGIFVNDSSGHTVWQEP